MQEEKWVDIPDIAGYRVSDLGRFRRGRTGKPMLGSINFWGYRVVRLNGKSYTAHILVARAFIGPRPPDHEVNHKDTIKSNNPLSNLEYLTGSQNILHAVRTGLFPIGERRWNSKLTDEIVLGIWNLRRGGIPPVRIAEELKISVSSVCHVVRGRNWKHLRPADWEAI